MTAHPAAPIESRATVTVYQIPDAPYRLRKPLLLEIERDEAGFVVSDSSTGVFHYDPDFGAAISSNTILSRTQISHGPRHTLGDTLINKMTHQIKLGTNANLVAMVDYSKSRDECLAIIRSATR